MKKGIFIVLFLFLSPNIYASETPGGLLDEKNYEQRIHTFVEAIKNDTPKLRVIHRRLLGISQKAESIYAQGSQELKNIIAYFTSKIEEQIPKEAPKKEKILGQPSPESVRSLYYTSFAANSTKKQEILLDFVKNTEVNSVTIDIKEVDGYVAFDMSGYEFGNIIPRSNNRIKDIKGLIEKLHENGVYVIGRIVVFKDQLLSETRPDLAIKWQGSGEVWYDYKGNKYLDPYSKEVWDYTVELSKVAYELGFDEINYDYVRFPSDGRISQTSYPFAYELTNQYPKWGKIMVLDSFSNYVTSQLRNIYPDIILSADIFGLVTRNDLFGIGQNLESFLLYFDYVGPMSYPSHYGRGTLGFELPDSHPYEIMSDAVQRSLDRIDALNLQIENISPETEKLKLRDAFFAQKDINDIQKVPKSRIRPWIQGFSCTWCKGYTPYNRKKFRAQIRAIEDAGLDSWWVWNSASNYYKEWYNETSPQPSP